MADATNRVYYCPIELTVDLIAAKWKPGLLLHLAQGAGRVGELAARVPLATRRVLMQLLRELERDGLVEQTLHSDSPQLEEFALTETGRRLTPILERMSELGESYAGEHGIELLSAASEVREDESAAGRRPEGSRWLSWSWLPL